jgi:molybdopterin-biosynthesis enzyme MoeA-like protein
MHHLAGVLSDQGIDLKEVRVVSDDPDAISNAVKALSDGYTYVFTSGGIGPTHDDITADNVARAFDVHIDVRADARALLEAHYAKSGQELNEARLRMARIPDGADLIDNPVSTAPGFILKNVHVMAGVPKIFEVMVESVLPKLTGGAPVLSRSVEIFRPEGDIAGPLGKLADAYPGISMGSYPFIRDGAFGANIVMRGTDASDLETAMDKLQAAFAD